MAKSQWAVTASLKHITGKTGDYGASDTRFLHLWTVQPTIDNASGTAVSGGGYSPVSCSGDFPTVSTSVSQVTNNAIIQFTTRTTAAWGTVVAFSLHDTSSTGSDMYCVAALDNAVTISSGINVKIPVGSLVITES